jgi:hypothetical protein
MAAWVRAPACYRSVHYWVQNLKGKYEEFLRSRRWHTRQREAGPTVIAYKLRCLI